MELKHGQDKEPVTTVRPAYRWPYFVGAMVLLGMVLAVMWTLWSVNQVREKTKERERLNPSGHPVGNMNQTNQ